MTRLGRAIAAFLGATPLLAVCAALPVSAASPPGRPSDLQPPTTLAAAAHTAFFCPVLGILLTSGTEGSAAAPPSNGLSSPGSGIAPAAASPTVADLRVTLARLLAAHAFLLLESMRGAAQSTPDGPATLAALDANTTDLTAAFASVYGSAAGQTFRSLWQRHITDVLAYARAVAAGDTGGEQSAKADLQGYQKDFNAFITGANPQIDPNAEAVALQMHITQLLTFASGDYAAAYDAERASFVHMFDFGDQLAQAIGRQFPDRFAGSTALSPAALLRMTLDRLLAEHAVLAAEAMRAKLSDSPDTAAVVAALNANSQDMVQAIAGVYGNGPAGAFQGAWNQHVAVYLAYIDAVQNHDEVAREQQINALNDVADQLAQVLASADPKLSVSAVAAMLRAHSRALTDQVDAEAAGDYPRAVATVQDAYAHMFSIGDALAGAIAAQFPDRFRDITAVPPTTLAPAGSAPTDGLALIVLAMSGTAGVVVLRHVFARRHVAR